MASNLTGGCVFSLFTVQRQTEVVQELEYEISLLSNTKQILTEELKKLQRCERTVSLLEAAGGQIHSINVPST